MRIKINILQISRISYYYKKCLHLIFDISYFLIFYCTNSLYFLLQDPNTGFMTNTPLEVFTITPGRRYRFRMINSYGSVCPSQITVEGHTLTIIATDGEAVQPVQVNTIISFSGKATYIKKFQICYKLFTKIKQLLNKLFMKQSKQKILLFRRW